MFSIFEEVLYIIFILSLCLLFSAADCTTSQSQGQSIDQNDSANLKNKENSSLKKKKKSSNLRPLCYLSAAVGTPTATWLGTKGYKWYCARKTNPIDLLRCMLATDVKRLQDALRGCSVDFFLNSTFIVDELPDDLKPTFQRFLGQPNPGNKSLDAGSKIPLIYHATCSMNPGMIAYCVANGCSINGPFKPFILPLDSLFRVHNSKSELLEQQAWMHYAQTTILSVLLGGYNSNKNFATQYKTGTKINENNVLLPNIHTSLAYNNCILYKRKFDSGTSEWNSVADAVSYIVTDMKPNTQDKVRLKYSSNWITGSKGGNAIHYLFYKSPSDNSRPPIPNDATACKRCQGFIDAIDTFITDNFTDLYGKKNIKHVCNVVKKIFVNMKNYHGNRPLAAIRQHESISGVKYMATIKCLTDNGAVGDDELVTFSNEELAAIS